MIVHGLMYGELLELNVQHRQVPSSEHHTTKHIAGECYPAPTYGISTCLLYVHIVQQK
jgi:hypothetical protein